MSYFETISFFAKLTSNKERIFFIF